MLTIQSIHVKLYTILNSKHVNVLFLFRRVEAYLFFIHQDRNESTRLGPQKNGLACPSLLAEESEPKNTPSLFKSGLVG